MTLDLHAVPAPALAAPRWTNRFAGLGERFFTRLAPAGVPDPHWIATSEPCAALLGLPAGCQARWHCR
jgi:serine/tyrosine/threonine adenylyltransferase